MGTDMATQQSATVSITNRTDGNADIILFHTNSSNGTQRGRWSVGPGETSGPLRVLFQTGLGTGGILDYWSVMLFVKDGKDAGLYINGGTLLDPDWKECQLQHGDAGAAMTFSVDASTLDIVLDSGGTTDGMKRLSPAPTKPISHVFVLMLENRSFDNLLGVSGLPGITAATTSDSNSYVDPDGKTWTYNVQSGAPLALPTDPGHEFVDVVQQLCGQGKTFDPTKGYGPITNSGFAASYATSISEYPHKTPSLTEVQDIMDCFDSPSQLGVLYTLAQHFSVCDNWFSSLPGPTWPNRFFLHGASSSGFDDSPKNSQIAGWEVPGGGFHYPHGSIFQRLDSKSIPYRFYHDAGPGFYSAYSDDPRAGSILGAIPQVTALSGITIADFHGVDRLAADLQGPYPYSYTFIEPHYGDLTGNYAGGSSQHPMDDVYGGEHLLAAVCAAIQNSPYWESSMLIVTYDEHGGFWDHVPPPKVDKWGPGIRVPALMIGPMVKKGFVDHTVYETTSILTFIEKKHGLEPLGTRDRDAPNLTGFFE